MNLKLITLLSFLTIIIISCNKDDQESEIIPEINIIELSSTFLYQGDILTITGENFINNNYPTKILIDDISYEIVPTSNTQIDLEITEEIGFEKKNFKIIISDKTSGEKSFYIMPKTWHKIYDSNVIRAVLHNDLDKISILTSNSDYWFGYLSQLDVSEDGYYTQTRALGNGFQDLKMYNVDIGVSFMGGQSIYYTTDGFKTKTSFLDVFTSFMYPNVDADKVVTINETGFIVANGRGQHFRYSNDGDISEISNMTLNEEMRMQLFNIGKGSNDLYYEFGHYYKWSDIDNYNFTFIAYSTNGYDNWTLFESPIPYNQIIMDNLFFYDYNLIFSINEDNELIKSTDLCQTWDFVQSNVDSFFMKTETEWFKVTNDTLYHSTDSGVNWEFELDLPSGSQANYMDFKDDKMVIAGNTYLYIKQISID